MAASSRSTVFQAGMEEGRQQTRIAVLGFLQNKYINDPDRPDRDSPEAKYLLDLAKDVATFTESLELK